MFSCSHVRLRWNTLLLLFFATVLYSRGNEKDTLSIWYCDTPPTIDGNSEEWSSQQPFRFTDDRAPEQFRNFVDVYTGWDENQFYLCCVVTDTRLCTDKDIDDTLNIHLNDAVEVWIDARNDGKSILNENDYHFILDVLGRVLLFRGDKTLIELGEKSGTVPQRTGNTPMVYHHAVTFNGTVNNERDTDSGYTVELAVPWSAMGIDPHEGFLWKLDICLNDQDNPFAQKPPNLNDSLGEAYYLTYFHFVNWSGYHDFGYPNTWKPVRLAGRAGFLTSLSKHYSRYWLIAFLVTITASFVTIGFMAYRIIQLKKMPQRSQIAVHPVLAPTPLPSQPGQSPYLQTTILKAREYIQSHIADPLTSESLADHLAISVRQLQRVVKDELNTTPTNLIHIIRLERASTMLVMKEGNVTEIAYAVGYNDSSHFSKIFKKYYGISPSQYTGETAAQIPEE